MQCGQTMPTIGVSNSNQFGLVRCVYSIACSIQNHTHISIIFMHAWVTNIMISYSNIGIHFYIDYHLCESFTPTHTLLLSLWIYTTNFPIVHAYIYAHTLPTQHPLHHAHTCSHSLGR